MTTIDVAATRAVTATETGALLLDVRTPGEFETAHIDGAVNVPLDRLQNHVAQLTEAGPGQVVLICQSGSRASTAHAELSRAGLSTSVVMTGGMNAWIAAGAPIVRGRQRWSLERQVRLVAGLLVLVSVLLSVLTPWTLLLTAFVGAGLTYAGASDTCMMGLLLARLPYNRAAATDPAAALAQACRR